MLGLVGPNEPFGAAFTNVEAYEAVALTDCDLLCCNLAELEQSPQLVLGLAKAMAARYRHCLLYTSPSPRDATLSRMPSSA